MVTYEQAMTARFFHANGCKRGEPGPRGGRGTDDVQVWRRNGQTQTWKTRPGAFRIPVKFGMYQSGEINETNAWQFHVASECPESLRTAG